MPADTPVTLTPLLQTAKWLADHNLRAVAVRERDKAAIDQGWASDAYTPPDLSYWMQHPNNNIGVRTGKGLIDIDIDHLDMVFFLDRFLPPTEAVFGRKSKPRSHRLYRVPVSDIPYHGRPYLDPVKAEIAYDGDGPRTGLVNVEIRGDNQQTVMPGSVHASGELILWEKNRLPSELTLLDSVEVAERAVLKAHLAKSVVQYIWLEGQRHFVVQHLSGIFCYLDWSQDDAEAFFQAIIDKTGDKDPAHLKTVRSTYKRYESGKHVSGNRALRELIGELHGSIIDDLMQWSGDPRISVIQDYNDRYAVVNFNGKFRIARTDHPAGEPHLILTKEDFENFVCNEHVFIDNKRIPKAKIWLADSRRRSYNDADFLPGVVDPDSSILNLWTGWPVKPKKDASCDAWLELLESIICGEDEEAFIWCLNWFASILKEPMNKSQTALVLIGVEGAGKTLLFNYFGRILGNGYVHVTNDEHVHGKFNKHMAPCLLLHADEALYAGDKKHASIIRSLITDQYRMYEQKGIDAKPIANHLRLSLTSNDQHAAPAKPGDRRYTVINMHGRKLTDELRLRVVKELNGDGPAALFHLLTQQLDYKPDLPRITLKNTALMELKGANQHPIDAWWYEILINGRIFNNYLDWAQRPVGVSWPVCVSKSALMESFGLWADRNKVRVTFNFSLFFQHFKKLLGRRTLGGSQLWVNEASIPDDAPQRVKSFSPGSRHQSINDMPDLIACRKAFDLYQGQAYDWPEVDWSREDDEMLRRAEDAEQERRKF